MYRDIVQWSKIRHRVLVEGISQRQIVRETGVHRATVRKMLAHPYPQPRRPRGRRHPKLGPHIASIERMLRESVTLPPAARPSIRAMHEYLRDQEGFRGSYGAVKDYVRPISQDHGFIWECIYDLLVSLEKKQAIDFLFYLSRADPPVISSTRTEQLFRKISQITATPAKPDKKEQAKRNAFEWMHALLQKEISDLELRCEYRFWVFGVGMTVPMLEMLLGRWSPRQLGLRADMLVPYLLPYVLFTTILTMGLLVLARLLSKVPAGHPID